MTGELLLGCSGWNYADTAADKGGWTGEKEGKIIVYTLTDRGKQALSIAKRKFTRTFLGIYP